MRLKTVLLFLVVSLNLVWPAKSQVTETYNFNGLNISIPDATGSGVINNQTISSSITAIGDLNVRLNIAGRSGAAFNGDLYATLIHDSGGRSVLLNRVGKRSEEPNPGSLGYGDDGLNVTFDDTAGNGDIHIYRFTLYGSHTTPLSPPNGPPLTGSWQPDGRESSPSGAPPTVLDTDTRSSTAMLGSFNGLNPSGSWTLYVEDVSGGSLHQLNSWGMTITAVPEPYELGLISGLGLAGFAFWRRLRQKSSA